MATNTSTNPTRPADILAARPTDGVAAVGAPGHRSDLTCADVLDVADLLGIDFAMAPFSVEELQLGINVELTSGMNALHPSSTSWTTTSSSLGWSPSPISRSGPTTTPS